MIAARTIEVVLFDLDETLYPRSAGLMQAIGRRIGLYMEERLGMPPELVSRLRPEYFQKYGTSLRGLQIHHHIDADDYLDFVHDVVLSDYIGPDPALQAMLSEIAARKVVFTNAHEHHARSVLRVLGIEGYFETIIDVRTFQFVGKPDPQAYQLAVDLLAVPAAKCLLVEDNVRNLRPGKALGMVTVLVGDHEPEDGVVDYHLDSVLGVRDVLSQLEAVGLSSS